MSITNNHEFIKIKNARKIILRMMKHRGYCSYKLFMNDEFDASVNHRLADYENGSEEILEEDAELLRTNLTIYFDSVKEKKLNSHIFIFSEWIKVGVNEIQILIERAIDRFRLCNSYDDITVSLVLQNPLTSTAIKTLEILPASMSITIHIFMESELQIDISKHKKISLHEICTPKEKLEIMKYYSVTEGQLPHVFYNDPITKYIGGKKGDLIKITRKSETWECVDLDDKDQFKSLYYRLVV